MPRAPRPTSPCSRSGPAPAPVHARACAARCRAAGPDAQRGSGRGHQWRRDVEAAAMRLLVTIVTGLVVAIAGVLLGAWWTPFVIGVAFGLVVTRPVVSIGLGAAAGFLAWLLP